MNTEMDKPAHQPIIELWRVAALALVVATAMLFVHAIVPADAGDLTPSAVQAGYR